MSLVLAVLAAGLLHVALPAIFPGLPVFLETQVECVTPISSFKRLLEGVYLYDNGISPYEGGPFHQSPLFLSLFYVLPENKGLSIDIFHALINALAAYHLGKIAAHRGSKSYGPVTTALIYMLNPFTLLGSLARSTQTLSNAVIVTSFGLATSNKAAQGAIFLAFAACLSWYPGYYLPCLIAYSGQFNLANSVKLSMVFGCGLAVFTYLAYIPLGSWNFIQNQYGTQLLLRDLTSPNLGLWWYFFIELFEPFRPFFLGGFQLFLASFPVPLSIRFERNPLFAAAALAGILAMFKPYPEVSDIGLYISLLCLNKRVLELLEYPLITGLGLLYVGALAPAFYYLWIYVGSGNANFFYAITLVYCVTLIISLADTLWAAIRLDHDGGKSETLTQI